MIYLDYTGERAEQPKKLRNIKKQWDLKSYMEYLDSQGLIFKNQEHTHCKSAALDYDSCDKFQAYLQQFAFQRQRVGILYGTVENDGQVKVDLIYEPPHEATSESFLITTNDKEAENVQRIVSSLGYQQVGWIFAHPPERDYLLSSAEVLQALKFQSEVLATHPDTGKFFITVKVSVTDEGASHFEAFQLTDQALKLYRAKLFESTADPKLCRISEEVLMARQGVGRKDSKEIDPTVFLKPVAVVGDYRGALHVGFTIENRPDDPQSRDKLKSYLTKNRAAPFLKLASDFHLLLFLANNYLSADNDIPPLCEAIKTGNTQTGETFHMLVKAFAGLA